jgi:hypothetical protein
MEAQKQNNDDIGEFLDIEHTDESRDDAKMRAALIIPWSR